MMAKNDVNEIVEYQDNSPVDVERALDDWEAYQELTEKLLVPSDYQKIKNKKTGEITKFKKKSAWRKYRNAFKISTEIIDREIIKNKQGIVQEATFVVRATSPRGDYTDAYGNCSRFEKTVFQKPNHDIPATAQTRATNRAISDLIGAGEVSAEEATFNENPVQRVKKQEKPAKSNIEKDAEKNGVEDAEYEVKEEKGGKPTGKTKKAKKEPTLNAESVEKIFKKCPKLQEAFKDVVDFEDTIPKLTMLRKADQLLKDKEITQENFNEIKKLI